MGRDRFCEVGERLRSNRGHLVCTLRTVCVAFALDLEIVTVRGVHKQGIDRKAQMPQEILWAVEQGTKEGLHRFAQAALQPDPGVVSFDFPAVPDFPSTTFASVYGD